MRWLTRLGNAAAVDQTIKVLEVMRQRPDTAKDWSIIRGQSFGSATNIAVAAMNPTGVQVTINFAGVGSGNTDTRPRDPVHRQ